jgi:hypothetical protein
MIGAFAQAMARKYSEMEEFWATFYDVHFGGARVVGQYCPFPCIDPMLVIDHTIQANTAYLINGYRYQGRV